MKFISSRKMAESPHRLLLLLMAETITTEATGNGRLDAVSNALKKAYELKFTLVTYQEHALEKSSSSKAIAYVGIQKPDGTLSLGSRCGSGYYSCIHRRSCNCNQ